MQKESVKRKLFVVRDDKKEKAKRNRGGDAKPPPAYVWSSDDSDSSGNRRVIYASDGNFSSNHSSDLEIEKEIHPWQTPAPSPVLVEEEEVQEKDDGWLNRSGKLAIFAANVFGKNCLDDQILVPALVRGRVQFLWQMEAWLAISYSDDFLEKSIYHFTDKPSAAQTKNFKKFFWNFAKGPEYKEHDNELEWENETVVQWAGWIDNHLDRRVPGQKLKIWRCKRCLAISTSSNDVLDSCNPFAFDIFVEK